MHIYNRYIFRTSFIATLFISLILIAVTMLTQSLRFLELIVESGASTWSFWLVTFLNLPRFLEIIIPIGLATSVIFIFNRMTLDSELSVLKATGFSQWSLARPVLLLACIFSLLLLIMTTWLGPASIAKTNMLKQILKSQLSGLIFKEGVFNDIGNGLTFYIRDLDKNGELHGLVIHDSRIKSEPVKTIYAKKGILAETETGNKIIVFDGARQDYDSQKKDLKRLQFDRYSINLPAPKESPTKHWKKPKERTLKELLLSQKNTELNETQRKEFRAEAHLRLLSPFLTLTYVLIGVTCLLSGTINRQGQSTKIILSIATIVLIQSLYITLSNVASKNDLALIGCYALVLLPIGASIVILRRHQRGENFE